MSKDYYKLLEVDKGASGEEIKKAFRKKAHKYHPDKTGGDEAKFKEINEAYQVLGNEQKRKQYDQFGSSFPGSGAGGGSGYGGAGGFSDMNINMDDLGDIFGGFGDIFGGFGGRTNQRTANRAVRGSDLQLMMTIEFKEAVFGVEKEIIIQKTVDCDNCHGTGAEPGSSVETCPRCGGRGSVSAIQNTILGQMQTQVTCPDCNGEGKKYSKVCTKCSGAGSYRDKVKFKVQVPAGIDNAEVIKLSGRGNAGSRGGPSGDMYIKFKVENDRKFKRDGYDILTKEEISITQAILGDKIEVETVEGKVKLKIPEGTQSGTVFNLKDKGIAKLKGRGKGSHLIEIQVKIPRIINRKQKKILEELNI